MKSMSGVRRNEQGIVSILVTMIMMIVISLIVLGFSQISRRNQREALDNQLSTQAYYAAESGVNAAVNYLTGGLGGPNPSIDDMGSCSTFIGTLNTAYSTSSAINQLDAASDTRYTCLMVDTLPSTLSVSPLTQQTSAILHLANTDNQAFTDLNFAWSQQSPASFSAGTCKGSGGTGLTLPVYGQWNCPYGILRLDLVDTSSGDISNAAIQNGSATASFYLVPSYSTGGTTDSVSWPPATQPIDPTASYNGCNATAAGGNNCPVQVMPVRCTNVGNGCSADLRFATGGSTDFYLRMSMIYQDSANVTITGGDVANSLASGNLQFAGGQALIDSTGQSQDELRRIQVRIPLNADSGTLPLYGLQTTDSICKQLSVGPGLPYSTGSCIY